MINDNSKARKRVGEELASRLERFESQFQNAESASKLAKTITVRAVKLDILPREFTTEEIKGIRTLLSVSQAVFAKFLGVGAGTVKDWEQGKYPPGGPARRIMEEIEREPDTWRTRVEKLARRPKAIS